jgi:hypothetical protein
MSSIPAVKFVSLAKMRKVFLVWPLIRKSDLKGFTTQNYRLQQYMCRNYTLLRMQKAAGNSNPVTTTSVYATPRL